MPKSSTLSWYIDCIFSPQFDRTKHIYQCVCGDTLSSKARLLKHCSIKHDTDNLFGSIKFDTAYCPDPECKLFLGAKRAAEEHWFSIHCPSIIVQLVKSELKMKERISQEHSLMMQQIQLMEQDIYNSDIIINQQEQLINNIERELLLLRESPSNKPPPTPLPPQLPSQTIPRGYIINRDLQFNMTPSPIDLSTVDDLMIEEPNEPAFLKNIPIAIVLHQVEIPNVETEDETCTVAVSYKFTP